MIVIEFKEGEDLFGDRVWPAVPRVGEAVQMSGNRYLVSQVLWVEASSGSDPVKAVVSISKV